MKPIQWLAPTFAKSKTQVYKTKSKTKATTNNKQEKLYKIAQKINEI